MRRRVRRMAMIAETIRRLGYVDLKALRRWFNLSSLDEARRILADLAKRNDDIELVYAVTFEKPGPLTMYTSEHVEESRLDELRRKMESEGWQLKSMHIVGARARTAEHAGGVSAPSRG